MPVTAFGVRFESIAVLLERLDAEGVTAVYVPESLATALSSILQVTRARGLVSLSGGQRLAAQGVSMGVFLSENGPRLILNRRSLQIEGADLSAGALVDLGNYPLVAKGLILQAVWWTTQLRLHPDSSRIMMTPARR